MAQKDQGGVIKFVFMSIILMAVMGFVTNIMVSAMDNENDVMGVFSTIAQYGPTIVLVLMVMLIVVIVSGILRYLGMV